MIRSFILLCTVLLAGGLLYAETGSRISYTPGGRIPDTTGEVPADVRKAEPTGKADKAESMAEVRKLEATGKPHKAEPTDRADKPDEAAENPEKPQIDTGFSAITPAGLTIAEDGRWYYEQFDAKGRPVRAVYYDKDVLREEITWVYADTHNPVQKKTQTAGKGSETIRYNTAGLPECIEVYDEAGKLHTKTDRQYDTHNNLIEETVFDGKHSEKSVWQFAHNKAVSQTKYRNGEKRAFIELHDAKRIVHLYVNGTEVLVTEEP